MGNVLSCIIFKPPKPSYTVRDPHLHMIPGPNGYSIAAYFIRHRRAEFTIFFSHGNAEDIGNVFHSLLHRISNWNCNFFVYDYAGYGMSGGTPSEDNIYSDAEVAFDYMVRELGVDPSSVICFGRSLGSAPSMHLAVRRKICGLILQCPIASIFRIKAKKLKLSLPYDMFCNIDIAPYVKVPTLIIHGTNDETVPIYGSKRMAKKIEEVYYLWVEGGMHNDLDYKYTYLMESAIQEYLHVLRTRRYGTNYRENLRLYETEANKLPNDVKMVEDGLYRHGVCSEGGVLYHSLDSITNHGAGSEIGRRSKPAEHVSHINEGVASKILVYKAQYGKGLNSDSASSEIPRFASSFQDCNAEYSVESSIPDKITKKCKRKYNPLTHCFCIKTGV